MIPRFYRLLKYTPGSEVRPVAEISRSFPVQSSFENYKADSREELLSRQDLPLANDPKKSAPEINSIKNVSTYSHQNDFHSTNGQSRILPFWEKNHLAQHLLSLRWLVAYDGSPEANQLWKNANALAKIFGAQVSGVYIQDSSASAVELPKGVEKIVSRQIIKTILQHANDEAVSLIWVGTHARKGKERVKKGSVAETIIKEAACPVWVYKESKDYQIQKILIPIDRMSESHFVIEEAMKLSQLFKAHLYFLHVSTVQEEKKSFPNLHLEAEFLQEEGNVAECIIKTAAQLSADLILMRTHSEKIEEQILPSGIALDVLRVSPCSLLMIQ